MKLSDLFTNGVIVAVHVSEWRARLGISPGDIKVDWSPEVERAMYLGAHRLADAAAFERIHAAAAEALRASLTDEGPHAGWCSIEPAEGGEGVKGDLATVEAAGSA